MAILVREDDGGRKMAVCSFLHILLKSHSLKGERTWTIL